MVVVIHWIRIAVHEVIAADVVDIAVLIVVHTIAPDLIGIGPDIRRELAMEMVDARVDHGNGHADVPGGSKPSRRGFDRLWCPLVAQDWITALGDTQDIVGLGILHLGKVTEHLHRALHGQAGRQTEHVNVQWPHTSETRCAPFGQDLTGPCTTHGGPEPNQKLAGGVFLIHGRWITDRPQLLRCRPSADRDKDQERTTECKHLLSHIISLTSLYHAIGLS
jgi:hypothetical protein